MSEHSMPEMAIKAGTLRKRLLLAAVPLLLVAASATSAIAQTSTTVDPRIVGGVQTYQGEFPFMAGVQVDNWTLCGGSVINSRWVMTAAHCAPYLTTSGNTTILLGAQTRDSTAGGGMQIRVDRVVAHPQFDPSTMANDITLLHVTQDIPSKYTPINFAQVSDTPAGSMATVSGWGRTSPGGSPSQTLMKVNLPIQSQSTCSSYWGNTTAAQVCAGTIGGDGKDSCNGDSGGPLFVNKSGRFYQVGIVSFGSSCASASPGVYVRPLSYASWIASVAGPTGDGTGTGGGTGGGTGTGPTGYTKCGNEGGSCTFSTKVDVAYGANGQFKYKYGVTGTIALTNANFGGDPIPGVIKAGYYKNVAAVTNVALGKPTSQSSNQNTTGISSRAVDGNTNGMWSAGSVTHTQSEKSAWWKVDLGRAYTVSKVRIWNRTDCCSARLSNFTVYLTDTPGNTIASKVYSGTAGVTTDIAISGSGVYSVWVQLNGTNYLSLAEVEVFGQ